METLGKHLKAGPSKLENPNERMESIDKGGLNND
jgi:hypothetical protein